MNDTREQVVSRQTVSSSFYCMRTLQWWKMTIQQQEKNYHDVFCSSSPKFPAYVHSAAWFHFLSQLFSLMLLQFAFIHLFIEQHQTDKNKNSLYLHKNNDDNQQNTNLTSSGSGWIVWIVEWMKGSRSRQTNKTTNKKVDKISDLFDIVDSMSPLWFVLFNRTTDQPTNTRLNRCWKL